MSTWNKSGDQCPNCKSTNTVRKAEATFREIGILGRLDTRRVPGKPNCWMLCNDCGETETREPYLGEKPE